MGTYTDAIGDRLDHPERVPAEYQHLIADDQQRVARILSIPVSGRVLDVGCSDGAIARRIAARWNVDVTGCDLQPHYRWTAQYEAAPMVRYTYCDVRRSDLVFTFEPFDVVYACEVFEHLTEAEAPLALYNILNVLKPGGTLIMTVPNRHPHDRYAIGCRSRWAWPDHRSGWDRLTLSRFLRPCQSVEFLPVYDGESVDNGIWIIANAVT